MISWKNHHRLKSAASLLRSGGVVAYPTEAVWGLGCDPFCESAVDHILAIKRRKRGMGLILIASSMQQLAPYLVGLESHRRERLAKTWPGPHTWLIPDNGVAPSWITGGRPTLAVRVTDHPVASALCEEYGGPIVSTSANPHGFPPAKTALKVRLYFQGIVDDVLPGSTGSASRPTAIRDLLTDTVIRAAG